MQFLPETSQSERYIKDGLLLNTHEVQVICDLIGTYCTIVPENYFWIEQGH